MTEAMNDGFLSNYDVLIEIVSEWPEFERYTQKLKRFRENIMEKGRQAFDVNSSDFNTLIHGNMWTNNIVMKPKSDDSDETENVIFIDFQFACWSSSTIDLQHFFNTSLSEEVRMHHFNDLINYYHEKLTDVLKELNYGKFMPTLSQLHEQFHSKNVFGMNENQFFEKKQIFMKKSIARKEYFMKIHVKSRKNDIFIAKSYFL